MRHENVLVRFSVLDFSEIVGIRIRTHAMRWGRVGIYVLMLPGLEGPAGLPSGLRPHVRRATCVRATRPHETACGARPVRTGTRTSPLVVVILVSGCPAMETRDVILNPATRHRTRWAGTRTATRNTAWNTVTVHAGLLGSWRHRESRSPTSEHGVACSKGVTPCRHSDATCRPPPHSPAASLATTLSLMDRKPMRITPRVILSDLRTRTLQAHWCGPKVCTHRSKRAARKLLFSASALPI